MNTILEFVKNDIFLIILFCMNILLIILYILNNIKLSNLRKSYLKFMKDLGNGNNIEETLQKHIKQVKEVENTNNEIIEYCRKLDDKMNKCIQKVGIIRYNAFKDTGSDLSFALALLDKKNNGVVLNGIFSRETSNIYAKPVINGESKYRMTEEEKEAIKKAIDNK